MSAATTRANDNFAERQCSVATCHRTELRRSWLAPWVIWCYRLFNARRRWRIGRLLLHVVQRLEGGAMWSATARRIMHEFHGVQIGAYSYGEIFDPALIPPGVTIGRYVAVARGARLIVQNHPLDRLSTHPFFYEGTPGVSATADIPPGQLRVGNDVWIGCNAIICPGCRHIGDGAVIGAGAVVTHDVPPYAIVAGNPARTLRLRFSPQVVHRLQKSRWWELTWDQVQARNTNWDALLHADTTDITPEKERLTSMTHNNETLLPRTASIVIPAHNEAAVIERCLGQLLAGARPGELEIVVVCNGCTDDTAARARAFEPHVRVVETEVASKTCALNLGNRVAETFPRFYVDADVHLSIDAVRRTARLLSDTAVMAAAPAIAWNLQHSNFLVRAFYAVWRHQPYFDGGRLGAGVYALSAAGVARLGQFPSLTADDEYVRRLFSERERATAEDAVFGVVPPRRLRDLIRIKTRSRRGNWELRQRFPQLFQQGDRKRHVFAARVARRPRLWPAALIYLYVVLMTALYARRTIRSSDPALWERDDSSRDLARVGPTP